MTGPPPAVMRYARLRRAGCLPGRPRCKDGDVAEDDYSPEAPWVAPANPIRFGVEPQSKRLDLKWVTRMLDSELAELLIRAHLEPQDTRDKTYMDNWKVFWRAVGFSGRGEIPALMERWLADADHELAEAGDPDSVHAKTVRRFRNDVDAAYNRLLYADGEPLAWAGPVWSKYGKAPRRVIEALVAAISLHQSGDIRDAQLYGVLAALALDPGPGGDRIDPDNLRALRAALTDGEPLQYF